VSNVDVASTGALLGDDLRDPIGRHLRIRQQLALVNLLLHCTLAQTLKVCGLFIASSIPDRLTPRQQRALESLSHMAKALNLRDPDVLGFHP
jgi:hypothetical protein